MPEIIETTVYQLNELSDAAKDRARSWYREHGLFDDWHEPVYDDFQQICAILGVELKTTSVRLFGGGTAPKPRIYFSGFWSQGDGACFEATYAYARAAAAKIRKHAPRDAELHAIVDALQASQHRNFYQLTADITHRGRYYHEHSIDISVERDGAAMTADAEGAVIDSLHDLARWLYRHLEREYEYQTSDAVIDEALLANAYTFTAEGRRFG